MNNPIHMPSKVWNEISYPFPNFNGFTVVVWEWILSHTHTQMEVGECTPNPPANHHTHTKKRKCRWVPPSLKICYRSFPDDQYRAPNNKYTGSEWHPHPPPPKNKFKWTWVRLPLKNVISSFEEQDKSIGESQTWSLYILWWFYWLWRRNQSFIKFRPLNQIWPWNSWSMALQNNRDLILNKVHLIAHLLQIWWP